MARVRTTAKQADILDSVRDRLIERIDDWSETSCIVADEPNPLKFPPSDQFGVVSPTEGVFPDGMFAGGGEVTLTEETGFLVTAYVRHTLDQNGRLEEALLSTERGLLTHYKWRILKALLEDAWEPGNSTNEFLRDQLSPVSCSAPAIVSDKYVGLSVRFKTVFDWDLS